MAEKLDPKETVSILELTVSHMWSIAALVQVLERKGVLTKQELRDAITELRRQTPKAEQANPPLEAIPEPYVMTERLSGDGPPRGRTQPSGRPVPRTAVPAGAYV